MSDNVSFFSDTYPYKRVLTGINRLKGAELIPYKILTYLIDMPDARGYTPTDDNTRARVRLIKYLWHDGADPLSEPLPSPTEKLSLLYTGEEPAVNTDEEKRRHPKGYRLYMQRGVEQSLTEAKTLIKLYPGRVYDESDFKTLITMNCEIWTNYGLQANTKTSALDRTFNIEQCLREALAGVDIAGVGTIHFAGNRGGYTGSELLYTDGAAYGRMLYFTIPWAEGGGGAITAY